MASIPAGGPVLRAVLLDPRFRARCRAARGTARRALPIWDGLVRGQLTDLPASPGHLPQSKWMTVPRTLPGVNVKRSESSTLLCRRSDEPMLASRADFLGAYRTASPSLPAWNGSRPTGRPIPATRLGHPGHAVTEPERLLGNLFSRRQDIPRHRAGVTDDVNFSRIRTRSCHRSAMARVRCRRTCEQSESTPSRCWR